MRAHTSIILRTRSVAPLARTMSRMAGQSPAMLPIAQTACSQTSITLEPMSATSGGTPLFCTTVSHCFELPEAMLVRHQAASN